MGKGNRRNTGNTASGTHKINGCANGKNRKVKGLGSCEKHSDTRETKDESQRTALSPVGSHQPTQRPSRTHTLPTPAPTHTLSPPHLPTPTSTYQPSPHLHPHSNLPHTHTPPPFSFPTPPPRTCPRSGLPESLVAGRQDARRKVESATRAGDHGGGKAESRSQTGW